MQYTDMNFPSSVEIFGFSGKMGSGKNYVAEKIFAPMMPPAPTLSIALADHFKVSAISFDGLSWEKVYGQKDENTRQVLQRRGTEEGRQKYGENIWLATLQAWMRVHAERGIRRFLITDIRFPNEVMWVRSLGGKIFRIIAHVRSQMRVAQEAPTQDAAQKIMSHSSETALDFFGDFDYILNNDSGMPQEQIYNHVRNIVQSLTPQNDVVIFCDLDDTICVCQKYYNKIIGDVLTHYNIPHDKAGRVLQKHIETFHFRYFDRYDFANSLINVVEEYTGARIDESEKKFIISKGISVFDQNYSYLTPQVPEILDRLAKHSKLVIFTLGDYTEQMRKIAMLGLYGKYDIEIFGHKDVNMFRHLKQKYVAKKYLMIGDSIYRDIQPAAEAKGISTFFVGIPQCSHCEISEMGLCCFGVEREIAHAVEKMKNAAEVLHFSKY
jgi:phosphomevalonate kinase